MSELHPTPESIRAALKKAAGCCEMDIVYEPKEQADAVLRWLWEELTGLCEDATRPDCMDMDTVDAVLERVGEAMRCCDVLYGEGARGQKRIDDFTGKRFGDE